MRAVLNILGLAAMLALACAAPARAQTAPDARAFQPPAGCTAYLTVQMASCTVDHHFTCEGDPEGWQRRVVMDEGGVALIDLIDEQTRWLEVNYPLLGETETLAPSSPDSADFDTLLATGLDTYDFMTESAGYGPTRYVGYDRLTGETAVIDGVSLESTEFEMTAYDAADAKLWTRQGQGYISRDWRMFLSGVETSTTEGETTRLDDSPVEFLFPGEPGFLSGSPRHGCGMLLSSFDAPAASVPEGQG